MLLLFNKFRVKMHMRVKRMKKEMAQKTIKKSKRAALCHTFLYGGSKISNKSISSKISNRSISSKISNRSISRKINNSSSNDNNNDNNPPRPYPVPNCDCRY